MTIQKLRAKLREYVFAIYPTRPITLNNPRATHFPGIFTPKQLWDHLSLSVPPITSVSLDDLRRAFSQAIGEYTVARDGITIKKITYQSEELGQYYLSKDPGNKKVSVLQHPATVGHIWVVIPGEGRLLRVRAKDEGFNNLTVAQWDETRRKYRLDTRDSREAFDAARARAISDAWTNDATPIKSNKAVQKARQKASKDSKRQRALDRSGEDIAAKESQERESSLKLPRRISKIRPMTREEWVNAQYSEEK